MLEGLFPLKGGFRPVVQFEMDQPMNTVLSRECAGSSVAVLVHPANEVARHPDLEGAGHAAGEDVDGKLFHWVAINCACSG
jgi:hypothetical protein